MVIYYQLVYYCAVDVLRWEFVLVSFFYHLCHVCEVLGYRWSVLHYYQVVMVDYILEERSVVWQVLE